MYFKEGKYHDAIEYCKKSLIICLENLLFDHPFIADCYEFLSIIYRYDGEIAEASKLMEIAIEQRLKEAPANQIKLGYSYLNLGELWADTYHHREALNYYRKAEKIWCQHLPKLDTRFVILYAAIGYVYGHVKSDFIVAGGYLEKALEIEVNLLKTFLKKDSILLGHLYNALGENYCNRGKYMEALTCYEKSSAIYDYYLSPLHIDWFNLFSLIDLCQRELEKYSLSITYHEKALDILLNQKSVSQNKELIGATYGNITAVHVLNGLYRKAINYFEKEINIRSEIISDHSVGFIVTYSNLGNAYLSINDYSTALKYLNMALDISKETLPKYHETLSSLYNNLGILYKEQGKLDQAIEYFQLSLEVQLHCLSPERPSLVSSYNNLACTYASMLNYDKSVKNFEDALAIFHKHEELNNPVLAKLKTNIGFCYYRLDDCNKAKDYLQQSLTILQYFYIDGEHFQFASMYNALALVKCA
ncbi:unnamed protein product [Rotaria sp. Silwood1]|nr:unnamed protein product [Rotaria sp. Silwood1]CAF3572418.1 unnamed protein product [Rotaria sp. Silwood1]CAF3618524.1 unnamed protein product [Rotaria sp. Silwood1]CAF4894302.1 unnamed protein product [Rotaria sp. Silwood1]